MNFWNKNKNEQNVAVIHFIIFLFVPNPVTYPLKFDKLHQKLRFLSCAENKAIISRIPLSRGRPNTPSALYTCQLGPVTWSKICECSWRIIVA